MKKNWSVEVRADCKICGGALPNSRHRTYCSAVCRNKANNSKARPYQAQYQKKRNDEQAEIPSPNKLQCLVCGRWYIQVCSHTFHTHGLTGRQYREMFDLEVKRGVVPPWYRKEKGEQALENGTFINILKGGKKYRFKKGQEGLGKYHRSPTTMNRLSQLYKYKYKKNDK